MAKNKTTYEARGVLIELHAESTGDGHKARISTLVANEGATITDLVKAAMAAQSALMLKASKAKRKAAGKTKIAAKKGKGRGKREIIAVARAPRPRKEPQVEMFSDAPDDAITPENMEERFPPEFYGFPPPSTANSCVMG